VREGRSIENFRLERDGLDSEPRENQDRDRNEREREGRAMSGKRASRKDLSVRISIDGLAQLDAFWHGFKRHTLRAIKDRLSSFMDSARRLTPIVNRQT